MELKQRISKLREKVANLTPEDYRGERKLPPEIQKKIDFIQEVRKKNKSKDKFKVI